MQTLAVGSTNADNVIVLKIGSNPSGTVFSEDDGAAHRTGLKPKNHTGESNMHSDIKRLGDFEPGEEGFYEYQEELLNLFAESPEGKARAEADDGGNGRFLPFGMAKSFFSIAQSGRFDLPKNSPIMETKQIANSFRIIYFLAMIEHSKASILALKSRFSLCCCRSCRRKLAIWLR